MEVHGVPIAPEGDADAGSAPAGLRFAPRLRILKSGEFERIYAQSRRLNDAIFSINVSANPLGWPRLGLSVGARNVGNAVARNRVKRVVRESFRVYQRELPSVDIVVGARSGARGVPNARLRESLAGLWKKIAVQCAAPSRS